jgi:hypothetical protein
MSDFSAGDKTTKGSTKAAGSATTTHQFTGSVYIKGLLSASLGISASTFVGDGSGLSGVGATDPAGSDRQIQYNDGGGFGANAGLKFTSNGLFSASYGAMFGETVSISAQDTGIALTGSLSASKGAVFGEHVIISAAGDALFVSGSITAVNNMFLTGTLNHTGSHYLSGTLTITGVESTPMLVMDDQDASAQIGRAHIGYDGADSDMAIFAHQDHATANNFAIRQRGAGGVPGQTDINAANSRMITFCINSNHRMRMDGTGLGIGSAYSPSYLLDVSGSTRIGTDPYNGSHKLFVTGGIIQTGSTALFHVANGQVDAFVISGSTGGFNPSQGLMNVDTNAQWVRFGGGINIPSGWAVNFGASDGQGNGDGGKFSYGGANLEISGAHNSTSIFSGSVNFGYDTPTFTIDAGNGAISAKCDTGESSGFTIAGPTALTGSEQYQVLLIEAADKTSDNGNPVLAATSMGVGIGIGQPLVALDVVYEPTNKLDNDTGGGETVFFGGGSSLTAGALYYLHTDGNWTITDADAVGSGGTQLLAIAKGTTPGQHGMLVRGWFDAHSQLDNFSAGKSVWMSTTAGKMDTTVPAGSGDVQRVVGYCTDTSNVIYFNPDGSGSVI